ncbi:unnamed protein product [Nippostrongylus brasiliensis]|uniref:PAP2_C domain-containing protein n=1 Tax=Nippostrongylus brasiliensis TaxID=27835 RepID=A0A0N4YWB1_NIPBR|nr:unnamed protein product [Nippostrongylus brasiliensis]
MVSIVLLVLWWEAALQAHMFEDLVAGLALVLYMLPFVLITCNKTVLTSVPTSRFRRDAAAGSAKCDNEDGEDAVLDGTQHSELRAVDSLRDVRVQKANKTGTCKVPKNDSDSYTETIVVPLGKAQRLGFGVLNFSESGMDKHLLLVLERYQSA